MTLLRTVAVIAGCAAAGALVGVAAPTAALAEGTSVVSTQPTAAHPASVLVGRWVGSFAGYADGRYGTGDQKFIITKARGHAAWGTVQWRYDGSGGWSTPTAVGFTLVRESRGVWSVTGADRTGTYAGVLRPNGRMNLGFTDSTEPIQVLRFNVTRR